ncbi:MAG: glycoside hydrolase family 3 C-terminal domain-containing protein [Treponema sp.]|nr:glycoside hydrolase family 3 C-terminal domain-containing protein [Treponema sp.]
MTAKEIVSAMTLEEKASLCSGRDLWMLKSIERLGLSPVMVADGPHGLRKQIGKRDHLGAFESVPSTCFPTAATTACSFDRDLLFSIGQAMGEECLQEKVAVILGPGINIKRSPLCGRNFEYFSEDPYISGEMSAALINGVQSKGIGTSLKHYAVNNQEKARFVCNSVVDERALREIYLAGFEKAVKQSQPWTVMGSYNPINGVYGCENNKLLTEILRDEWGFKGIVVTDWGACNDRVEGIKTGLDLEMPGGDGINDAKIVEAVNNGSLDIKDLDKTVLRLVTLILTAQENGKNNYQFDKSAHHALARKAASESAVLLKNDDNLLPVKEGQSIALMGGMAKTPRYQGAGSSRINPVQLDNVHDALSAAGISFDYAQGYSGCEPDQALIEEAVKAAIGKDKVIIIAGMPDEYESEGFDRTSLDMPPSHNQLIEAVAKVNPNVIVVLQLGAPVVLPWADKVKSILSAYLGGQAGGSAITDLLLGKISPGGKLAETWPLSLQDIPCHHYFPGKSRSAEYRESIFVGYRYYDHGSKEAAYPFGHGLSYTSFEYSDLNANSSSFKQGDTLKISFTIKNTGKVSGAETAQVYVAPEKSSIMRALKELKGFDKVFLRSGESKTITITLDTRSFAYYNAPKKTWALEDGSYEILVGASSRDIKLKGKVQVKGDGLESLLQDQKNKSPEYFNLPVKEFIISDSSFEALYGQKLPPQERPDGFYDLNSTLAEIKETEPGKKLTCAISQQMTKIFGDDRKNSFRLMMECMMEDLPLRSLGMMSGGLFNRSVAEGLVDILNGKPYTGGDACSINPELAKLLNSSDPS